MFIPVKCASIDSIRGDGHRICIEKYNTVRARNSCANS